MNAHCFRFCVVLKLHWNAFNCPEPPRNEQWKLWGKSQPPPPCSALQYEEWLRLCLIIFITSQKGPLEHNVLLMRDVCVFTPPAGYDVQHVDDVKINLIDCEQTIEVAERGGMIPPRCGRIRVNNCTASPQHNHASRGEGRPLFVFRSDGLPLAAVRSN
jgi:hypothetical protein